ncbi:MAG: hypothetical protein KJ604_20955, partial [Gammaproteobacteria bacterium]|nr:hypothetical protein [Gammaproteobacteria bacterium]
MISSFVIEEWSEGLGIERMNINIARDTKSFWDVDSVDTRFPSMLVKSPLFIECTVPSFGQTVKYGEPCFSQVQFFFGGSGAHMSYIPPNTLGSTRWIADARDGHTTMG